MTEAEKRAGESPSELLDGNGLKIGIAGRAVQLRHNVQDARPLFGAIG